MTKNKFKKTAIDIVRHLPSLQQITASQLNVAILSPAWLVWSKNKFGDEFTAGCRLSSLVNGKLIIVCNNATIASQIKHQQKNLLNALNQQNNKNKIETIVIQIHSPSFHKNDSIIPKSLPSRKIPSDNALKTIKNYQKSVKNENLAKSLASLVNTLQGKSQNRK